MQSYAVITTVNFKPFISSPKETAPFATCQLSFLAQIFSAFVGSDFFTVCLLNSLVVKWVLNFLNLGSFTVL